MPSPKDTKCEFCGKLYTANGIKKHYKSCPKNPNKSESTSKSDSSLERRVSELETRMKILEDFLNLKGAPKKTKKVISSFRKELESVLQSHMEFQVTEGTYPLEKIKRVFLTEYSISQLEFEENIKKLYKKRIIDLQPGGNPQEYGIISPHGQKYHYLIYIRRN